MASEKKKKTLTRIDDPLHLLKLKFVNGDLSLEEFKEKIEVLEEMNKS